MTGKGAAAPSNDDEAVLDVNHRLLDSKQPLHYRSTAAPVPPVTATAVPPR
jgi:hypothetical protein